MRHSSVSLHRWIDRITCIPRGHSQIWYSSRGFHCSSGYTTAFHNVLCSDILAWEIRTAIYRRNCRWTKCCRRLWLVEHLSVQMATDPQSSLSAHAGAPTPQTCWDRGRIKKNGQENLSVYRRKNKTVNQWVYMNEMCPMMFTDIVAEMNVTFGRDECSLSK